jgi:pimeloyl-ACP methyl ester carboxylesterase
MMDILRKAGVTLLDYGYVLRHQLRSEFDRSTPDALVAAEGGLAPVVLLPGIFETWRFLRPLATHIHGQGHPVHVVTALERNLMAIAEAAAIVADHLARHDLTDVTIVAHSKGGLVAKHLMGMPGAGERIRRTVAVCTPFAGSTLARFVPFESVRSLQPTNADLLRLAEVRDVNARIVAVTGWFDPHIPNAGPLEGARNVQLTTSGHFRILASPELLALVDRLLAEDAETGADAEAQS